MKAARKQVTKNVTIKRAMIMEKSWMDARIKNERRFINDIHESIMKQKDMNKM